MEQFFYLQDKYLKDFLSFLAKSRRLFVCQAKEDDYFYANFSENTEAILSSYRAFEPLKTLLIPAREKLNNIDPGKEKPIAVFTAKACDISALAVQDFIFLGDRPKFGCSGNCTLEQDDIYAQRRKEMLIISADCTNFKEVCWCLGVGLKPYPESGFDINFSYIAEGFVVEIASDKGRISLKGFEKRMLKASAAQIAKRDEKRKEIVRNMEAKLTGLHPGAVEVFQEAVKKGYESESWKEFMLTCVECGGCNFICDTCHCFLLSDEKSNQAPARLKLWDSCLYVNFSRVAGGANPLNTRAKRLRNRFLKKFDFFPDNLGKYACCGCGRCIEVCPGKIDIRKILKTLCSELSIKK